MVNNYLILSTRFLKSETKIYIVIKLNAKPNLNAISYLKHKLNKYLTNRFG
jgi:hypothetical protein